MAKGPSSFSTSRITPHLVGNLWVIEHFMGPQMQVQGQVGRLLWMVWLTEPRGHPGRRGGNAFLGVTAAKRAATHAALWLRGGKKFATVFKCHVILIIIQFFTVKSVILGGPMIPADAVSFAGSWIHDLSPITLLFLIALVAVVAFVTGKTGQAKKTLELEALRREHQHSRNRFVAQNETVNGLESTVASLEQRNKENNDLISLLPDVVEKLNTSDSIERLLRDVVVITERLLKARDVSVFLHERGLLVLKAASGSAPLSSPPLTMKVGEGKIGWVAAKGLTMTDQDLMQESNLVKSSLAEGETDLVTRICSPMIYGGELLGLVNIGSFSVTHAIGLRMVKMLTSLASVALGNLLLKNQIKVVSDKDGLTGLYTLQCFLGELRQELSKARRYKRPFGLCHFNIDSFAKYNDMNGYLAGDEVLRMISKVFKDHLREHDMVARYGGKEFVLLCPETRLEDARLLADKLKSIIADFPFPHKQTMPGGGVTVSGGVTAYPEGGSTEEELIRAVVVATKQSQRSGGNCVSSVDHIIAAPGMTASSNT
jgi:diguanylate cyclase (GGDEF)-like protein